MTWQEAVLKAMGPGALGGLTVRQWLRLLLQERFRVAVSCWPRAGAITWHSLQNSLFSRLDRQRIGTALEGVHVPPPLFVLGHWRQGTSHLHNLLTVDQRFGFPNNYQTLFPHTVFTMESRHSRLLDLFMPKRRPMDNMEWNMRSPQEDEFALSILTFKSPYMGWIFPQRRNYFDRYLTFRDVDAREV